MKFILFALTFVSTFICFSQNLEAEQILEKSIKYHDPNGNWATLKAQFKVEMTTPKASKRTSIIRIDLPKEHFSVKATRDTTTTVYTISKDKCYMVLNGKDMDSTSAKANNMSCEKAELYKNYYTYLYGLPMKLKDPGTNLNNTVEKKNFKGKDYLVLKVTYDVAVGSDIWYFYFNPKTFAMEVYQFYKTDENGNPKPDSGEYIILSEEMVINGIKMPKIRAWYYNKNDEYLGTDTLVDK